MKLPILLSFLFTSVALPAASVNDGITLTPSVDDVVSHDAFSVVPSLLSTAENGSLMPKPVTAEGIMPVQEINLSPKATAVPESVGAVFVALFGFVLMLRRR